MCWLAFLANLVGVKLIILGCFICLLKSIRNLEDAQGKIKEGSRNLELIAEDIRSSVISLDALIGRVDVENVLDEIFSSFCLGK